VTHHELTALFVRVPPATRLRAEFAAHHADRFWQSQGCSAWQINVAAVAAIEIELIAAGCLRLLGRVR
jgi:hypothetical protein